MSHAYFASTKFFPNRENGDHKYLRAVLITLQCWPGREDRYSKQKHPRGTDLKLNSLKILSVKDASQGIFYHRKPLSVYFSWNHQRIFFGCLILCSTFLQIAKSRISSPDTRRYRSVRSFYGFPVSARQRDQGDVLRQLQSCKELLEVCCDGICSVSCPVHSFHVCFASFEPHNCWRLHGCRSVVFDFVGKIAIRSSKLYFIVFILSAFRSRKIFNYRCC